MIPLGPTLTSSTGSPASLTNPVLEGKATTIAIPLQPLPGVLGEPPSCDGTGGTQSASNLAAEISCGPEQ